MQGCLSVLSLSAFSRAVSNVLGREVAATMSFIVALQFHLPFYCSRSLPNSFALILNCHAYGTWLEGRRPAATITLLAFSSVGTPYQIMC